jgi:two-component system sensor histidine kinase BarA
VTATDLQQASIKLCLQKPIHEETLLKHLLEITRQDSTTAIDWPMCVQRVSGNQTLAADYLACFVQELKKNRAELIQCYQLESLKMLEAEAHRLHGACCFCGVPALQSQVALVENLAKHAKNMTDISDAFKQLIQNIDAVLNEYEQLYCARSQPEEI